MRASFRRALHRARDGAIADGLIRIVDLHAVELRCAQIAREGIVRRRAWKTGTQVATHSVHRANFIVRWACKGKRWQW